jgi:hypothetical protein
VHIVRAGQVGVQAGAKPGPVCTRFIGTACANKARLVLAEHSSEPNKGALPHSVCHPAVHFAFVPGNGAPKPRNRIKGNRFGILREIFIA